METRDAVAIERMSVGLRPVAISNVQRPNFADSLSCHSERSKETVFRMNAENESRFLGSRAARDLWNDIKGRNNKQSAWIQKSG